jgi:ABC-type Mn2+/Zn2+ transport system ATPase subunit
MDQKTKLEIIDEIRYSILNKRILEVTHNLAVRNPKTNELIFLKQRPNFEGTPLSSYIEYNEIHDMNHNYSELIGKSIIIDKSLLTRRGIEALEKIEK